MTAPTEPDQPDTPESDDETPEVDSGRPEPAAEPLDVIAEPTGLVGEPRPLTVQATAPAADRLATLTINTVITATDTQARTITGRVLTYGEVGETNVGPVRFLSGSLQAAGDLSRLKLLVEHDRERIAGYAEKIEDRDGACFATFRVATGDLGDDVLASAASKLRDSLSVGVTVVEAKADDDGVLEVSASQWRETSVCAVGAFPSASVTKVAATAPAQPGTALVPAAPAAATPAPPARPAAGAPMFVAGGTLGAAIAGGAQAQQRGRSVDQAVHEIVSAFKTGGVGAAIQAALSDIVPPANAGQRDALFRPQWLGQLWEAEKVERPLIDSITNAALTGFTVTGFRVDRPRFGVDFYAGNKTDVPSPGGFSVVPVTATARRIAGAHDIDRIFIDLGDESFVRSYFTYQAQNYAVLTENTVAADLLAGATPLPGEAPQTALTALTAVVQYLTSIGASTSFVAVGSALWGELLTIPAQEWPALFGGSATITDQSATIGNVRLALNALSLGPDQMLAGDRRAATFYEWRNPPLSVELVNLTQGGIDLGVFGYMADLINDPRALVSTTVGAVTP